MSVFSYISDALAKVIGGQASANNRAILDDVLSAAKKWKPYHFSASQQRRRDHYEGKGAPYVRALLKTRYPKTGHLIQVYPYNWAKLFAEVSAQVYSQEPSRALLGADGEEIDNEDKRSQSFDALCEMASLRTVMPESERRMQWAGNTVLAVRIRGQMDKDGTVRRRVFLDLHWPSDVHVIPHPSSPTDLAQAVALACKISGGDEDGEWFELWTRSVIEDANGLPTAFGKWTTQIVCRDGRTRGQPQEYDSPLLPFLILAKSQPDGCPWLDDGVDDLEIVEALNADISDIEHIAHMQGHTQLVYSGKRIEQTAVEIGPDVVTKIGDGETLSTVDYNPKIADLQNVHEQALKMWALTRRQSQDSYTTTPQPPASGVARQIANEPQTNARRESVARMTQFEQDHLLPLLCDAHDRYLTGEGITPIGDVGFVFKAAEPPAYEDPEAVQQRAISLRDAGLISDAHAAVLAGVYKSKQDAIAAGLSDEVGTPVVEPAFSLASSTRNTVQPVLQAQEQEITVNELSLGIERFARAGDIAMMNAMRAALAKKLGVPYGGDVNSSILLEKKVAEAEALAAVAPEQTPVANA